MNYLLTLIPVFLMFSCAQAQPAAPAVSQLMAVYPDYREASLETRRFTVNDLIPILKSFEDSPRLQFSQAGTSLEGRPVFLGKFGRGPVKILFWSQMHGDESTATMALMDFFHWLNAEEGDHLAFRDALAERLSLYFLPMLNPDGVEKFQRRNAAHIDLNRDALHLSSPESRILKNVRDSLEPEFGFNLHDQSVFYRSGRDGEQVAITFLAPAFDHEKNINGVRLRSMQLISVLHDSLGLEIPGKMATYDDTFEPRAFGDNVQKWGTSAVLVESGGFRGDPEKQYLRQLNFVIYIKAMESILKGSYQEKTVADYEAIPVNDRKMLSLKIKNLSVPVGEQQVRLEIGYLYSDNTIGGQYSYHAYIADVGDLSVYTGFEEFDASGMELIRARWYEESLNSVGEVKEDRMKQLIREGYLGFLLAEDQELPKGNIPLHFARTIPDKDSADPLAFDFRPGGNPTFILKNKNQTWIVKNGQIRTLEEIFSAIDEL